ncbi:PspA/IM30 family protein [Paenibacillus humicola]|uniref:PspA/IM30 family protein n=1 Tax=Paenibacillus humicola TaxID=3110540 RepID=UPI00237C1F56|nr:PspA/IM30 family protein [Paenibacillus humicola]
MGVLNRLIDMTKAAAHEMLDKMEDPALMLNHYVRKAQSEIESAEVELARQEAQAKSSRQQAAEFAKLAELCETKAMDAMSGGSEAGAREALSLKLGYAEKARELEQLSAAAAARAEELKQRLETAKAELAAMQKKRDELITRVRQTQAKAQTSMPSFSGGTGAADYGSAARGFQRMEEKIVHWETQAELSGNRYGYTVPVSVGGAVYGGPAAPAEHPAREAQINEQLERLRKRLSASE